MNSVFKKIISHFLLVTFLVASTPHDLFHLLADHHDTFDSNTTPPSIDEQHIHCEALQLSLPPFNKSNHEVTKATFYVLAVINSTICLPAVPILYVAAKGRAPPGMV
ncbi:MAG: hypothetical protein LH473_02505 [Chitinophagales bacterium]|nr:hypothetical protein [Chitinophagales bacterium]